jgi:endonuclease/exonuclease/phosphatase family metal-dependent hydrolase
MVDGLLNVASWNLHKGTDCWGRPTNLDDSLDALARQEWDLCFLQEAPGAALALFAKRHGMEAVYGYTRAVGGGHFGNAILVRKAQARFVDNHNISAHRIESRRALFAHVEWDGGRRALAVATHFGLRQRWRIAQAENVARRAREVAEQEGCDTVVMGGDFNDRSTAVSVALARAGFVDATAAFGPRPASYPAQFPLLPLDAIYALGLSVEGCGILGGIHAGWSKRSDHLPVHACLRART